MKLIAHRGMKDKENTIPAFLNAINSDKVSGFELDIRRSKDNEIMVIHDPFIDRVTDKSGLVSEINSQELNELGIPYLKDVLDLKTDKIVMVEVKDPNINVEDLVIMLEDSNLNIYLSSFNTDYLHDVLKMNPKFKVGPLHNVINREKSYNEFDFIALYAEFYTNKIANYFKNKNIDVFLWGLNEKTKKYRDYYSNLNDVYLIVDM